MKSNYALASSFASTVVSSGAGGSTHLQKIIKYRISEFAHATKNKFLSSACKIKIMF